MQRLGEVLLLGALSWDVAALLAHFLFLFLDWQEIVALYEKDNTYLGKGPNLESQCPRGGSSPNFETLGF